MANRLNWSRGKPGKGFILRNGDIHTWRVNLMDGPHHGEYFSLNNLTSQPATNFEIDPAGGVHQDADGESSMAKILQADPDLHPAQPEEDWSLPPQQPQKPHGPDFNFILSNEETDYADMLKQWLDGVGAPAATPISPHHQSPEHIVPQAPVSPGNATALYPPGHEPDWAKPASKRSWWRGRKR